MSITRPAAQSRVESWARCAPVDPGALTQSVAVRSLRADPRTGPSPPRRRSFGGKETRRALQIGNWAHVDAADGPTPQIRRREVSGSALGSWPSSDPTKPAPHPPSIVSPTSRPRDLGEARSGKLLYCPSRVEPPRPDLAVEIMRNRSHSNKDHRVRCIFSPRRRRRGHICLAAASCHPAPPFHLAMNVQRIALNALERLRTAFSGVARVPAFAFLSPADETVVRWLPGLGHLGSSQKSSLLLLFSSARFIFSSRRGLSESGYESSGISLPARSDVERGTDVQRIRSI